MEEGVKITREDEIRWAIWQEREACARIADDAARLAVTYPLAVAFPVHVMAASIATSIRARNKPA